MNGRTEKVQHSESNNGILSGTTDIEQENETISDEQFSTAKLNSDEKHHSVYTLQYYTPLTLEINNAISSGKHLFNASPEHEPSLKKAGRKESPQISEDGYSNVICSIRDESCWKFSKNTDEEGTSDGASQEEMSCSAQEICEKSPSEHENNEREILRKTDDLIKEPNKIFQKINTDGKWKPQENFYEEPSNVNSGIENELSEKCSQSNTEPQLISKEEHSEQKAKLFDIVGNDGLWQRCIFFWKFCFCICSAFHFMIMTFLAPDIDYWCAKPTEVNWRITDWKIHGLPEDKRCSRYKYKADQLATENLTFIENEIDICEAWEYDTTFYTSMVINQFNLVCGREWLASFSLTVFNIGTLISSFVIGYFADTLGRKRIIVACLSLAVFSATLCAFSLSYTMFVVTRFFTAFGLSGVYNVSYVLMLEITGPEERSFYGVAMSFGWCIGFISLPGVVWLLRDWFWIEIAITVPCVLLLITCWILSESPYWLIEKGRTKEAEKILIKAAKMNGRKISDLEAKLRIVMKDARKTNRPAEEIHGLKDIIRSHGFWQTLLNIWFLWFVTSFIFYGLSYNTNALAGDPFINFSVSGVVEAIGYFFALFVVHYLRRKKPLALTMIVGGIACISMYALPEDPWWLSTSVSNIGKCSATIASSISYIYTAEIFPTVVRNACVGSSSFFSRLGAILAPFVKELGNATHPVVPQIVFGVLSCFSGMLVFLLPETEDLNVSETAEDVVERYRKHALRSHDFKMINLSENKISY